MQAFFRTTSRDVEIKSCTIPAGSKVLLFLGAANCDPRRWENPDKVAVAVAGTVGRISPLIFL